MINHELDEVKRNEYLGITEKHAVRLQKLLNDFFALSTVDSEDYPIQLEAININSLLKEILLSYYDQFQTKRHKPTVEVTNNDLVAMIDEQAFKRVVENLLGNTIQHAAGDIMISLDQRDGMAVLMIKNKVIDASQIQIEKLFERFYTTDETRQSSKGLGLTIVQSLMKRMGGEITAELRDENFIIICRWQLASPSIS